MTSTAGYAFKHSSRKPDFTEILPYYSDEFIDLVRNAEQVLKNAQLARSSHEKFGDAWARAAKLIPDNHVVMGPPKELGRLIEKSIARYNGDPFQVSDACRSRILVDSPEQVKALKHAIIAADFRESANEKGIDLFPLEDCFAHPKDTGWRALVVKSKIDVGKGRKQLAETVVIPREWVDGYEESHKYLVNIRAITDKAKHKKRDMTPYEATIVAIETQKAQDIHKLLPSRAVYLSLEAKTAKPESTVIHSNNVLQFAYA